MESGSSDKEKTIEALNYVKGLMDATSDFNIEFNYEDDNAYIYVEGMQIADCPIDTLEVICIAFNRGYQAGLIMAKRLREGGNNESHHD